MQYWELEMNKGKQGIWENWGQVGLYQEIYKKYKVIFGKQGELGYWESKGIGENGQSFKLFKYYQNLLTVTINVTQIYSRKKLIFLVTH